MNKTTVIYHSADFDGIFCREIARKFLPEDTELVGWSFGETALPIPTGGKVYILDLPMDEPFGLKFNKKTMTLHNFRDLSRFIWIDYHKSSIESHPTFIPGYRIDGVAACRLAWQWFTMGRGLKQHLAAGTWNWPTREEYIDRKVEEPIAVRLAGEYDIGDKRDPNADTFQFALRAIDEAELPWKLLLTATNSAMLTDLLDKGALIESYQRRMDMEIARSRTFDLQWEGLTFLAINTVRCNSKTFERAVEERHDGLLGFYTDGAKWTVSLYHAPHRRELDLSAIAVKYGGDGHKGACGFRCAELPFLK